MNRFALLFLIGLMLLGEQSCKWLSRNHYKIDNPSPTGAYRVKAHVTVEDDDRLMGGFHEWGGIQFLKGDEILYSYSWDYTDNFETTFRGRHQYVTWSADNLLYMGANELTIDSPVDEIVITNRTKEDIRYLDISISKLTRVVVFDLAGASEITTHVPIVRGWSNRKMRLITL